MQAQSGDPGIDEHELLATVLQLAVEYDQLCITELASFELLARRFQLWEQFHSEELRVANAGAEADGNLDIDECSAFMGRSGRRTGCMVAPSLSEHVAAVLRDRAAILKERRKAKEEREESRKAVDSAQRRRPRRGRGRGSAADAGKGGGKE